MYIEELNLISEEKLKNKYLYLLRNNENNNYFLLSLISGKFACYISYKDLIETILTNNIKNKEDIFEKIRKENKVKDINSQNNKSYMNAINERYVLGYKMFKNDKNFIIMYIYLNIGLDEFNLNISFIKKDLTNGRLYANEFNLIDTHIKSISLDNLYNIEKQLFIDIYLHFKEELHQTKIEDSIKNINYLLKPIDNLDFNHSDEFAIKLLKFFPFLKIYPKNNGVWDYTKHNLRYELITQIFKPYERDILPNYLLEREYNNYLYNLNLDDNTIYDLLNETKSLRYIKYINPIANKNTLILINNLYIHNKSSNRNIYYYNSYLELLSVFDNPNNLNKFLKSVESFGFDNNEHMKVKSNKGNKNFIMFLKNDLPNFFTSKEKYENELIKYMKKYTEDKPIYALSDKYIERNIENLYDLLLDTYLSFKKLDNLRDKYLQDPILYKETLDKLNEVFHIKWNDFRTIHDELAMCYSLYQSENIPFKSINLKLVEDDEYILEEMLNSRDLRMVGIKMNICVGSYSNKVLEDNCSIFIIKKKDDVNNNDIKMCIEYDISNNFINQAKGNKNSIVTDKKIINLLEKFIKENNIKGYKC